MSTTKKHRNKKAEARWSREPQEPGFYVTFRRGHSFGVIFWPGFDDPAFDLNLTDRALYFGPFKLPLSV